MGLMATGKKNPLVSWRSEYLILRINSLDPTARITPKPHPGRLCAMRLFDAAMKEIKRQYIIFGITIEQRLKAMADHLEKVQITNHIIS